MNKKIKILIVLIILGLLIFALFISINKYSESKDYSYYHNQEKKMLEASKKYFLDYQNYLPKEISNSTRVVLNALIKEKYLKQIKDINNSKCNNYESYIEITKINNEEYLYKAHLVCDKVGYETKDKE